MAAPLMSDPSANADLADRLPDVAIDLDGVSRFAQGVSASQVRLPEWRGPAFPAADTEATAAYLLVANAVNFCFWGSPKWEVTTAAGRFDGSVGLFAALTRALDEGVPLLDGAYLAGMPQDDLGHILRGNVRIPLFGERLTALRELGTVLTRSFGARPADLIARADGDAVRMVDLIVSYLPSFDDRADYRGTEVAFQKRAQLVPAMLHARFRGRRWGRLRRLDELTVFADYKLPQVLRESGVLHYSEALSALVDAGRELPSGGPLEVQIRIATLRAGHLIRCALADRFPQVTAVHVDGIIWTAGQSLPPTRRPYHRTRTICY